MKPRRSTSSLLLWIVVSAFIPTADVYSQGANSAQSKDVKAVRAAFEKLVRAFNERNAQAAVASFADDSVLVSPLSPDADYKTISEGFMKQLAAPPEVPFTIKVNVEEIQTSGDLAFVRVTWTRERNSDKEIIAGEKDFEIWRRQKNGDWKLACGYSFPLKKDSPNWTKGSADMPARENVVSKKTTKVNSAKDVEAIKEALEKAAQSYNGRDLAARMSLYAADSLLTYPGMPDSDINRTRQNYGENFSNLPPFPFRSFYEIEEIQTSGDLAFVRMMWFVERQSDKQIISRLKDLEIWQRQRDGSWKLARGLSFHLRPETPNKQTG